MFSVLCLGGREEEIESEYELLVPQGKLKNYSDWNEIFDMVENSRWKPVFKLDENVEVVREKYK